MVSPATTRTVEPVPAGFSTLTTCLTVRDAAAAIDWYTRAFGAQELCRAASLDGTKIWNAQLQLGTARIMLNDECPEFGQLGPASIGGTAVNLHLYVEDADAVFAATVEAGATVTMPLENAFWGDRYGRILDPFGHDWAIATHIEDPTPEEMMRRMRELCPQAH